MAQRSIALYFNCKKRPAVDLKIDRPTKIVKLDQEGTQEKPQDKPPLKKQDADLSQLKKVISRSDKLKELTKSIQNFNKSAQELKKAETKTKKVLESPKIKSFKSLEFEVLISPTKAQSPEKLYLSPKKDGAVKRNLFGVSSPSQESSNLPLPFKYKTLTEMFRASDTCSQIFFNRKETITFKKLKSGVEEMLKRTFLQKHLAQIKSVYPNSYDYAVEKMKVFGSGSLAMQWELVVKPKINEELMTTQILLNRRKELGQKLVDKIKVYHNEFLLSLTPPMCLPGDKLTRWHPEFDLEKVPDLELAELPEVPNAEKPTSGREVLENVRRMFNCNKRLNQALTNLEATQKSAIAQTEIAPLPPLASKGIPKALLEKVRQRQAEKALLSMTRSADKEKELQMYARLPELVRLIRGLFVSEKKTVLGLDVVVEKLTNSYRGYLDKKEIVEHLKEISKQVPDWLVFHELRKSVFLKISKNADLAVVIKKLEQLGK